MARERTERYRLSVPAKTSQADAERPVLFHVITGLMTGGAEMMLLKLLTEMRSSHFRPVVVSLGGRGAIGSRIESLGVPVHALGLGPGNSSAIGLWRLRCLLKQARPSLVQGWMYHGNLAASVADLTRTTRVPVIWNVRQSLDDLSREKASTARVIRAGALLSRLPQRIIFNSQRSVVQHAAIGYSTRRTVVIANGFDCEVFKPSTDARLRLRKELGVAADTVLVGLIARFHPAKDHQTFFRAAALLSARYPDVHYVLAGQGMDTGCAPITIILEASGVSDKTHLLGERQDVQAITAALDIASLSSRTEAFPNVVGEAMAAGVPCVATDTGDTASIIGNLTALVPVGNADALAAGWAGLIERGAEGRRALGSCCRERILTNFSLSGMAAAYIKLYRELLAGGAR
jgi:glycosyltransferase involved in cell wall biosynthesis